MLLVIRALSAIELLIGSLLALGAVVMFANAHFCFFNQGACGMVEPILAVYGLALAVPLVIAGRLHSKRKVVSGTLALVPVAAVVVVLIGQAKLWW